MDTIKYLKVKVDRLTELLPASHINAVLRHIQMAEQHFNSGNKNMEEDFYSDVIYRTNQAFEGGLKESYSILAGKDPKKKTAFYLESYFTDNEIFKDRVTDLFTNYRTKWRNPSTHDHLASFSEAEAFLSILSVTSFTSALVDQMIGHLVCKIEKDRLAKSPAVIEEQKTRSGDNPFVEHLSAVLSSFFSQSSLNNIKLEVELAAKLKAYLLSTLTSAEIIQGPTVSFNQRILRPDFLIIGEGQKVVVELKLFGHYSLRLRDRVVGQIKEYMDAVEAAVGIMLLVPANLSRKETMKRSQLQTICLDKGRYIIYMRGSLK